MTAETAIANPPPRAITQIAATGSDPDYLYALANDGTLWRLAIKLDYGWFRLPDLPPDVAIVQPLPAEPVARPAQPSVVI